MANTPEIRFRGFREPWEQRKVGDMTIESTEYTTLDAGYPLLTSSRAGLMYQNEYRGNLTTDSKETLFSVVPIGACTYRHMSDDDVFHLNINTLEKGLVSREYPVFFATKENCLNFIIQYINSSALFRAFCAEQKKGGTRTRLYYNALCEFKMMVPSKREQEVIAGYLLSLDHLITLHQRKYDEIKEVKKYMLQKMFPKNGEKVPEIRFSGFTASWEQRKLGEVSDSYSGGTPTVGVKEYYGGQIPFIRSAEINSDCTELFITDDGLKNSSARLVSKGDILYALYGATSGEVGRARLNGAINQAILAIKPYSGYDYEFISQWLRKSKQSIIETYLQGGQGNLSGTIVKDLVVQFPTLPEQEVIGTYFANLDHLITLYQHKCDELKEVKKFMLQNMFPRRG